ncbi:protein-L-isoaspartate O-methyltransferase [Sphingomonas sp.]|uniref:protein-L-isoaspartate O-methyltransferase family protein n=1 Tax=Sphingomonas sp. TaxID=28214 RepID=UPI0017C07D65|nr:protein-L-isoaspartate O-methyltransferase [Sphingomonas sp.]MBA3511600.1 protein-L-isoaspartate O-methyltransferase [Sphingomonas sp.]
MTVQLPIPDFAAARRAMIENQLRPVGVTDPAVLQAMGSVAREQFVPEDNRPLAYADRSVPIGGGRYLAAPAVLGQLLTQMAPKKGERALVVGAGTGYAAAVLAAVGCDVTALESSSALAARAREIGINTVEGPLEEGHSAGVPYDLIVIDGAVEFIPDAIIQQLVDGGRLGAALAEGGVTRLIVGQKVAGAFGYLSISDAAVAALPGFSRPRGFRFER